jgi:branched-chain amino acid transport system substrate-binding protein
MSRVIAELTLEAGTRLRRIHPAVPLRVLDYANAFFTTTRDSLRFM